MIRILKAFVILVGTLLLMVEQAKRCKEKRTKSALALLIVSCAMFVSAIIIAVSFWT